MAGARTDERPSRVHKQGSRYKREAKLLGLSIRALRTTQGLTLEQAAERCDLDLKHLQKIESGLLNVTLVTLVRLAAGLQQPLVSLFAQPRGGSAKRTLKRKKG